MIKKMIMKRKRKKKKKKKEMKQSKERIFLRLTGRERERKGFRMSFWKKLQFLFRFLLLLLLLVSLLLYCCCFWWEYVCLILCFSFWE